MIKIKNIRKIPQYMLDLIKKKDLEEKRRKKKKDIGVAWLLLHMRFVPEW